MFGFDNKAQQGSPAQEPMGAPSLPQDQPHDMPVAQPPQSDQSFLEENGANEGSGWINDDAATAHAADASSLEQPQNYIVQDNQMGDQPVDQPHDDHPGTNTDDLLSIKQSALHQLSPLVDHLDQTPEEKFKTTMMMIQASDDQSLIPAAYDAANAIKDEKLKAQALLDIVNEINYFTQHSHQG